MYKVFFLLKAELTLCSTLIKTSFHYSLAIHCRFSTIIHPKVIDVVTSKIAFLYSREIFLNGENEMAEKLSSKHDLHMTTIINNYAAPPSLDD